MVEHSAPSYQLKYGIVSKCDAKQLYRVYMVAKHSLQLYLIYLNKGLCMESQVTCWTGLVDWTCGLTLKIIFTLSNDTHSLVGLQYYHQNSFLLGQTKNF